MSYQHQPDNCNVWYPKPPLGSSERVGKPDTNGCVALIALVSLCCACFWFGMWLGSRHPPTRSQAEASSDGT